MKKIAFILVLFLSILFYHQYRFAGPYSARLRKHPVSKQQILDQLKKWRYHTEVWFEIVPDAFTTLFKRLGIGGWSETGERVCVEGCAYWTEWWTDGFYTVDLELLEIRFSDQETIVFREPRYIDVEIWGKIRHGLQKKSALPNVGEKWKICGPLREDRPYHVFTVQPDRIDDFQKQGSCQVRPKNDPNLVAWVMNQSEDLLDGLSSFDQIAILDTLSSTQESRFAIEKMLRVSRPEVLSALATHREVYQAIVKKAPSAVEKLPALIQVSEESEDQPVRSTIRDLF